MSVFYSLLGRLTVGVVLTSLVAGVYGKPPSLVNNECLTNVELVELAKEWLPKLQAIDASVSLGDVKDVIKGVGDCITTESATTALVLYSENLSAPVANSIPVISGIPDTLIYEGGSYSFTPDVIDHDGDRLSFSVSGAPIWSYFDTTTGTLSGTPGFDDADIYPNIEISVSDGKDTATLDAFSIEVINTNRAPEIGGSPLLNVPVNNPYSFVPSVFDADGDPLIFDVQGLPEWASFDPQTGELSGIPTVPDTYSGIVISVSDGYAEVALDEIVIRVEPENVMASAMLSWQIPTTRTDGSTLYENDIGGYRVYQGDTEDDVVMIVDLADRYTTSFEVKNLTSGIYYFRVTVYDVDGNESGYSDPAMKDI